VLHSPAARVRAVIPTHAEQHDGKEIQVAEH